MSNKSIILGIDPGLLKTGWGVVQKDGYDVRYVDCGVIKTKADQLMEMRLVSIFEAVTQLIEKFVPDDVAMEEVFVNKNPMSSEKLIMARTASFLAIAWSGHNVKQFKPNEIKKNITGSGHAAKEQVYVMIQKILKTSIQNDAYHTLDSMDALAVATCFAFT